jgi:hypothetical protein
MTNWRDRTGGPEVLVREGDKAEWLAGVRAAAEQHGDSGDVITCTVSHEDAGGQCERSAVMEVYGLFFCEVHGAVEKAISICCLTPGCLALASLVTSMIPNLANSSSSSWLR